MSQLSHSRFCPVAMASELLCTRWTMILLRELLAGSTRFNDLRRSIPRMSPTLLSQRLKDLEEAGIVVRQAIKLEPGVSGYYLTKAGQALLPVVEALGFWGQRWFESRISLKDLNPSQLMWDMRRGIVTKPLPEKRCVVHFLYPELPASEKHWWLVVEQHGEVDLCAIDPGFDVDLYVTTDLRTMTGIWMGLDTISKAIKKDKFALIGDRALADMVQVWLEQRHFAKSGKRVA